MKLSGIAALLMAHLVASGPARAEWFSTGDDNAFSKEQQRWAFTMASSGAAFGFRCDGSDIDKAGLVFVMVETIDDTQAAAINLMSPQLAVIIDDGKRRDFPAQLDTVSLPTGKRLRAFTVGAEAVAMAAEVAGARRRVSVAMALAGKVLHATNFSSRGSRREIDKAFAACGLQPAKPSN